MRGIAESVRLNAVLTMHRGRRPAADHRHRRRRPRREQRRLRAELRVQGGNQPVLRRPLRSRARLLRADRLRGLGQHRRGDQATKPELPEDPVRRLAIAGVLYLHRHPARLGRRPDRRARRLERPARPGRRAGPARRRPEVFAAITLFALANGALINMIMASRLVYGMSEEGIVPGFFGRVLQGRRTPITAIVFTTRARADPRLDRAIWPTSPTRPCCCCWSPSPRSTSRCSSCARTRSTTTTSTAPVFAPILAAIVSSS